MKLDCGQPEAAAGHRMRLLFGLAPGGVYHALDVTIEAVRSYRSDLTGRNPDKSGHLFTVARLRVWAQHAAPLRWWAVCFLWHFP